MSRPAAVADDEEKYRMINFEETELRLGFEVKGFSKTHGKRGFLETVDLKLNLSSPDSSQVPHQHDKNDKEKIAKPPSKAQVVGWPPVRSFRKNIMAVQKTDTAGDGDKAGSSSATATSFVKVSMDGAPYLRKVDLKQHQSYQQLSEALGKMFSSFTIDNRGSQGMKDFMNESKLVDLLNGSEYAATYEDRDGDWMLVGDVPWEMFVNSCKRLRIMKGSEATGLAPRAVEKCKNRS